MGAAGSTAQARVAGVYAAPSDLSWSPCAPLAPPHTMTCEPVQMPRASARAGIGAAGRVVQCPAARVAADAAALPGGAENGAEIGGGEAGDDDGTNGTSRAVWSDGEHPTAIVSDPTANAANTPRMGLGVSTVEQPGGGREQHGSPEAEHSKPLPGRQQSTCFFVGSGDQLACLRGKVGVHVLSEIAGKQLRERRQHEHEG